MKKIFVIVLGSIMITILSSFLSFIFGDGLSPSTRMGHKITSVIGKKINERYGLNYMGISEAGSDGKYKQIGLNFNCKKILTKDEGRKLLLQCTKDTLDIINSYPQFRQYMTNYPFTADNIMIVIFIQPNQNVYYPNISVFSLYDNILHFQTESP